MAYPPRPDMPADAEVELEKVRLLFQNTGLAQAVVATNALILLFVLGGMHPPLWAVGWCAAAIAVAATRYLLARRFVAAAPDIHAAPLWKRRAIVSAFLAACLWAGGGSAMMIADPAATRLFVALVIAGMVAGAVPLLSSVPAAFRAYAVPVMLSVILTALLDSHGSRDLLLGLVAALYLAALLRSSSYFHDSLNASLQMASQMRQMADSLQVALKKAESASTAKTQFLATMSHEIRTPMNGILGMAQLLMMPGLEETERREYVQTILSSGKTLLTLLNDVLDLSKVEAGKLELAPAVFSPKQLIDELTTLFAEPAGSKGLALTGTWHGDANRRYCGDATRLRQMTANLLSNAIKFTDAGAVRLEVRETERTGERARLEFAVTDTGIGVAAETLDALFQPFMQADSSNTREYGGTGLGLSIVRNLATLMSGEVGASSEPGRGSRFWFTVEVESTDADPATTGRESREAMPEAPVPSGHGAEIMVVEDNRTNRRVIEALLGKLGLRISIFEDGQQALDAVQQGSRPSLILMDIQMPVMDGLVATRRIRAWEAECGQRRLPIVALTAGAFEDDRQQCIDAGMDDVLTKPINVQMLQATLQKWLPPSGQ